MSPNDVPSITPAPQTKRLWPPLWSLRNGEIEHATPVTFAKVVYNAVARIFHDRAGIILASTFLLLLLWGKHGEVQILDPFGNWWRPADPNPSDRAQLIPGVPWDQEWISFFIGFVVVVLIPCALIKWRFKQHLSAYGLRWPRPNKMRFAVISALIILIASAVGFLFATGNPAMRAAYPLYRGDLSNNTNFAIYELGYFLFFVAIEFIFRGYLLFGLYGIKDSESAEEVQGSPGPLVFGYYAILISMLSYTAWHIGKPIDEAWGTVVWGLVTGAVVLESGSILPIILVHWLLNVFLDLAIRQGWSL